MGVINGDKFVISGIEMLTTMWMYSNIRAWNVSIICLSIFFFSIFCVKHFHRHNPINVTLFHCWKILFFLLLLRSFPQQKTQYHFPMWLWWLLLDGWIFFEGGGFKVRKNRQQKGWKIRRKFGKFIRTVIMANVEKNIQNF